MTILFALIIAFAFFVQGIIGFGAGLIAIPLLSRLLPVQDAVTVLILFQFLMGGLIFVTYKDAAWPLIKSLIWPITIGLIIGFTILKYVPGDIIRAILAVYILVHLLRTHTRFDPFKEAIERGGAKLAGALGGVLQGSIGGGGPPFALLFKEHTQSPSALRASIIAVFFFMNIPRLGAAFISGMMTSDILWMGATALPGFLFAMILGQYLHNKVPQKIFMGAVDVILLFAVISLTGKILT